MGASKNTLHPVHRNNPFCGLKGFSFTNISANEKTDYSNWRGWDGSGWNGLTGSCGWNQMAEKQ